MLLVQTNGQYKELIFSRSDVCCVQFQTTLIPLIQGLLIILSSTYFPMFFFYGENISFDASLVIYIYIYIVIIFLQL
jgi:hypothetical protein